jgi:hypothetical protein
MSRYGFSSTEVNKRIDQLKTKCEVLINEANFLPLKEREQLGEVRRTLLDILSQGDYELIRRQGVLHRLRAASQETREALILFNVLENAKESEFQAYFSSLFGKTIQPLKVYQEIVRAGVYNELYWLPSPNSKSSPGPTRVKAIVPTNSELQELGVKLPPIPDIPFLIESYWQKGEYEILRFIDIVSHAYNGVVTTDESLPFSASIPGFIGIYGKSMALAPDILNQTKLQIELVKDQKIRLFRQTLESALLAVEKQTPDRGLSVLWTGQGETVWKFSATPPLYVYLTSWLTTIDQTLAPSRVNLKEKPHVLFVISCQSRTSFLGALERHPGFSLKDTRWEKSLSLLSNLQKPDFQPLIGQRHPLLDRIFEAVSQSG